MKMRVTVIFAGSKLSDRHYTVSEETARGIAASAPGMLEEWLMIPDGKGVTAIRSAHVAIIEVREHVEDTGER